VQQSREVEEHAESTQSGITEKSDEMVERCRQTLVRLPAWSPERAGALLDLADAVHERFDLFGEIQDLEDAITYYRQALTLCPLGDRNHAIALNNLANAVSTRFHQLGKMDL
jgi:sigma54-dependent transcription regulator